MIFQELKTECASLKKTSDLTYNAFELQNYLKVLYPSQARVVLKSRCKTLEIKTHSTYRYNGNTICRGCGVHEETFEHTLNCGRTDLLTINVRDIRDHSDLTTTLLIRAVNRFLWFCDTYDEPSKPKKRGQEEVEN